MAKIINGKKLAEGIKGKVVKEILGLNHNQTCPQDRPNLAIVLVGERPDSKLYVDLKEKEAVKVGIDTHVYRCDESVSEEEILQTMDYLNNDETIDAILVQLPLPKKFNTDKIIKAIDPAKDVDGFHPDNLKVLTSTCNHQHVMPPVFEVVLEILQNIKFDLKNKKVCLVINSDIFGRGLAEVLRCRGAEVEAAHCDDPDLAKKTVRADVLVTVVGKPKFISADMIKEGAVVIDVGITKEGDKVYGDVDFFQAQEKAGFITPVPGGVGPMTIAMLFKNTLVLYKRRRGK